MDNFAKFVSSISTYICCKLQCQREKSLLAVELRLYFPNANWHCCFSDTILKQYYEHYLFIRPEYQADTIEMIARVLIEEIQDKFEEDLFFSELPIT